MRGPKDLRLRRGVVKAPPSGENFHLCKSFYAYQFTYQISAWIFKILIFQRSERTRRWNCITMPNFVEIASTVAEA